MEKKNIIEKLKDLVRTFNSTESTEETVETVEVKLMDIDLINDIKAHVVTATEGEINIGDEFYLLDEEGNRMETVDGDYETNEGMLITVVGEKITDIKEVATEDELADDEARDATEMSDVETEEVVEETETEVVEETTEEEVTEEDDHMVNLLTMIADGFKGLTAEVAELKAQNAELAGRVNKFAAEPSAQPTKTIVDFKKTQREDKLKFFAKK